MADLDDFFAKKDKKKKTKKAGVSTVELVKKLEESNLQQDSTNLDQIEEEVPAPAATFEVNETLSALIFTSHSSSPPLTLISERRRLRVENGRVHRAKGRSLQP